MHRKAYESKKSKITNNLGREECKERQRGPSEEDLYVNLILCEKWEFFSVLAYLILLLQTHH